MSSADNRVEMVLMLIDKMAETSLMLNGVTGRRLPVNVSDRMVKMWSMLEDSSVKVAH